MHIGGLRTALFSYLVAKRTKGQFLLRIEDTDQKRLVHDAEQRLCDDLQWAGLQWDEGPQVGGPYGPYKQSERTHLYQAHAKELLESGSAYRCFCTPQTIGADGAKAAYVTSGCYQDCPSLSVEEAQDRAETKKEAFTVRLKQPADVHKRICWDLVYGKIQRLKRSPSASQGGEDNSGINAADTILIKSDGTPTYHFANVVDDHLMKITHVIRGTEWMASTPLHYDLYAAFGWQPPAFAHVGLLVDENQAKLSKRSSSGLVLDVKSMREEQGILPEVLTNFLALLGWSNPGRNDVLEMNDLIHDFDLKFTKGNTIVRTEKLWYLQKQHVARKCAKASAEGSTAPIQQLIQAIAQEAKRQYSDSINARFPSSEEFKKYCTSILLADSLSYQDPKQYVQRNQYFFHYDESKIPHKHFDMNDEGVLIKEILEETDFQLSSSDGSSSAPNSTIEAKSALIHAALTQKIWSKIANSTTETSDSSINNLLSHPPFTNTPIDLLACAQVLCDHRSFLSPEVLEKLYKKQNKDLMKYLRGRLSYGMPGPSVGVLMGVLGYEECCRRLGARARGDGGWDGLGGRGE